jgi:hypothetical protein
MIVTYRNLPFYFDSVLAGLGRKKLRRKKPAEKTGFYRPGRNYFLPLFRKKLEETKISTFILLIIENYCIFISLLYTYSIIFPSKCHRSELGDVTKYI